MSPRAAAKEFERQARPYAAHGDLEGLRTLYIRWSLEAKNWNPKLEIVVEGLMEEALQKAMLEPSKIKKKNQFAKLGSLWWPGKGE